MTFLGRDSEWEGTLKFRGLARIDCRFKGEISSGGTLIVGEGALIESDIHVSNIVVSGEVHGNITADQRVDIYAPGRVFRDIESPSVMIDRGVIFEGRTRTYRAKDGEGERPATAGDERQAVGDRLVLTLIHGVIRDLATGEPVRNAEVICKGDGEHHTSSNASGYYEVVNLKGGEWTLKVNAEGYRGWKGRIEIPAGVTCKQMIEMRPIRRGAV